jgi:hypothetical protein
MDFGLGAAVVPWFSIIGMVFNIVAFKRGASIGCLGLVAGAIGFVFTFIGNIVVGVVVLIALGLMAFLPLSAEAKAKRDANDSSENYNSAPRQNYEMQGSHESADVDVRVQNIEDDFIAGRIDRDTYVMRRRDLLG